MFNPILLSSAAGGTGPTGPLYAKKRIISVGEYNNYVHWTESTVTNRAALYALVQAVDPTIPLNAIMMDRSLCGGGGGGPSGEGAFGGFGAFMSTDTIALSAFNPDSDIHIEIGAGGAGTALGWGLQGSQTNMTEYIDGFFVNETSITAAGGDGGSVDLDAMKRSYHQCIEIGVQMPDPMTKLDGRAVGSSNGPGCGAWAEAGEYIFGGVGTRGKDDPFHKFGDGGISFDGIGEPGYEGGGGGASLPENLGADGGSGIVKIRFWVLEVVQ